MDIFFIHQSCAIMTKKKKKNPSKHQIRQREGVWSGIQAGEERPVYPQKPLVKIYTLNSERAKLIFTHSLITFFFFFLMKVVSQQK